jgi:lon-related putative ATP-dependent protease
MPITKLAAEQIRRNCDPATLTFETTAELPYADEIFGQPRAIRAIEFGIHMDAPGYNVFIVGSPGTGRMPAVQRYLAKHAPDEPPPNDWVYVHNFADAYRPIALPLTRGKARAFANAIDAVMAQVQAQLPRAFESGEYDNARDAINTTLKTYMEGLEAQLQEEAKAQKCRLVRGPSGFEVVAAPNGKAIGKTSVDKLPKKTKTAIEAALKTLNERAEDMARQVRDAQRQTLVKLGELDAQVGQSIAEPLLIEVARQFADEPKAVGDYLQAFAVDLVGNVVAFKPQPDTPSIERFEGVPRNVWLNRYRVNVFVDNAGCTGNPSATCGAPVVTEDNPTAHNLLGKIEHNATASGMMMTDHMMLRPGSLHKANGGFLVMRADALYANYFSWAGLKRSLNRGEIKIEDPNMQSMPTPTIEPQPIPLRAKVALLGDGNDYWRGHDDEDFRALFKVKAEFNWQMDRTPENEMQYAAFLRARAEEESLLPFDRSAVAKLVEFGSRQLGDQRKLSTNFGKIADIAREASFWAKRGKRPVVTGEDIARAQEERQYRLGQRQELSREEILRDYQPVQSDGEVVGQINGLAVMNDAEFAFGEPLRISARAYVGRGGINDIERGVNYTDSTHNKGIAIIESYLSALFSVEQSLSLTANVVFEQSYGQIHGDSASVALLCSMLSAAGNLPIKQTLAMTGTLDQFGAVQRIGGVNTKIEGWFDLLKIRGQLDGEHSVIIPAKNVPDLMLREDVVAAVQAGKFRVISVDHVDDAVEATMGKPAGTRGADGNFAADSAYAIVEAALKEMNEKLDGKRGKGKGKDKEEEEKPKDEKPPDDEPNPNNPPPPEPPVTPPEPEKLPEEPPPLQPPPPQPPAEPLDGELGKV